MTSYAYDGLREARQVQSDQMLPRPGGGTIAASKVLAEVNALRDAAKASRKPYESVWRLCQAFVAGDQWVGLTKRDGRVVELPNPKRRERHTVNVLTQYFWTAIGKIYSDDFMPSMLFARPDFEAQHVTAHAKAAFGYAWDEEVRAQEVILDLLVELCGYGTVAARCRWDNMFGKSIGQVPVNGDGQVVTPNEGDPAYQQIADGGQGDFREMREGKIRWDLLSVFNTLPPPGIPSERDFPYVILDQPALLEDVRGAFGDATQGLQEQDLSQVNLIGDRDLSSENPLSNGAGKLKGHVLLSTCYWRPTPRFPDGRTVTWSQNTFLQERLDLPYVINGEPKAGVVFFRYHRVPRRFWGIGLVEPGIGPQRQRNRARSQHIEMKDKNLGRVYGRKGSLSESNMPVGKIMEYIEVARSADYPIETSGTAPGPWITDEVQMNDGDLEKVMGFRDLVNSESMKGVTAYAAFALQAEQEDKRVGPILSGVRNGIIELSKFTDAAIRKYWLPGKQMMVGGDDLAIDTIAYQSAIYPESVYFRFAKGAPAPRSAAAELQKIFDVYDRSVSSGRPLGIEWLLASLEAGKCLPFPESQQKLQAEKAQLENMLMSQGHPAQVSPIDDHQVHIEEHQMALQQALLFGKQEVAQMIQEHIAQHQGNMQSQQQLVSGVPSQQGGFGAQGAPQRMAIDQAAGAAQTQVPA